MKPVAVVGSYNTGLTMRVDRLPREGETLMGTAYSEGPGGKGSNQAVAARRLGAKVSFVGCVGNDRFGDAAFELWGNEGVNAEFVRKTKTHTGLGFVTVDSRGANAITIDAGANLELSPDDVRRAEKAIAGCGVLLVQLEVPGKTVRAAAALAREHALMVILNPAPAVKADELDLTTVDVLTPNEQEFMALVGTNDLQVGARRLLSAGPKAVVVTLGSRGARVITPVDSYHVPAPRVETIDTTGAGDAFNGALAVALSEGETLRQAVTFSNYAGALTVTKREVIAALPTRREVEEFRRNDVPE